MEELRIKRLMCEEREYRHKQVQLNEVRYESISAKSTVKGTSPLLLDAVVTPIAEGSSSQCNINSILALQYEEELKKARKNRVEALFLARHYCNLAEKSQTDKRLLKISLEKQVETVRDFWHNKVVEGDSRSGRMLRNALITK